LTGDVKVRTPHRYLVGVVLAETAVCLDRTQCKLVNR